MKLQTLPQSSTIYTHNISSLQTYTLQTDNPTFIIITYIWIPHEMFINMKWQFAYTNNCNSNIQKTNPNKYKDVLKHIKLAREYSNIRKSLRWQHKQQNITDSCYTSFPIKHHTMTFNRKKQQHDLPRTSFPTKSQWWFILRGLTCCSLTKH